jgi:myosin heavy subunit
MHLVGFTDESIQDTLRTVAAVLHLGNIDFVPNKRSEGFRVKDRKGIFILKLK